MIAVDTNIIVRLLTKDDPIQYKKAHALFKASPIFISATVLLETEWVLRFCYEFSQLKINDALTKLIGLPNIKVDKPNALPAALALHQQGADFSDALHLAQAAHCDVFYTFDKKFITQAKNNELCPVQKP